MEDRLSKYLRLCGNVMLLFLLFIVLPFLVLILLRLLMGTLDSVSWFSYVYLVFMLLLPTAVFTSVFILFYKKTASHPAKSIRVISRIVFTAAILCWILTMVWDLSVFFQKRYTDINKYFSYNLLFLASNGFAIFLMGIVQALTTEREKDWFDKYK